MGAENMFRKVFGRKGLGDVPAPRSSEADMLHPALKAELARLDLFGRGLAARATGYVVSGREEGVLTTLEQHLATVSRHDAPYFKDNQACNSTQNAVDKALAKGEVSDVGIISRFIAVRMRVRPKITRSYYWDDDTPEARIRAHEAFDAIRAGDSSLNSHGDFIDPYPPLVPVLDPAQVKDIVCRIGARPADFFTWSATQMTGVRLSKLRRQFSQSLTALVAADPGAVAEAIASARHDQTRQYLIFFAETHGAMACDTVVDAVVALLGKASTKPVQARAAVSIARLDGAALLRVLERHLPGSDVGTRCALIDAAGRVATPEILAHLAAHARIEKTARVEALIASVLETHAAGAAEPQTGGEEGAAYLTVTGETIRIPPCADPGSDAIPAPTAAIRAAFAEAMVGIEAQRRIAAEAYRKGYDATEAKVAQFYGAFTPEETAAAFATLTTAAPIPKREPGAQYIHRTESLIRDVRGQAAGQKWLREALGAMPVPAALRILDVTSREGITGRRDVNALIGLESAYSPWHFIGPDLLREWLTAGRFDLRHVYGADDLRRVMAQGNSTYDIDRAINAVAALPADAVWPWLADNMEVFDEAFGLRPAAFALPLDRAMKLLAMLPATPQRYLPRLAEIAVAEKQHLRGQAKALLRNAKDLDKRIEGLLDDKRQPVRINAAGWLADIRSTSSEKALRKRLKSEKSDPVRAALIIALQRLGADLADVIGPASLIAEAERANAKTPPALPEWLVASRLPPVRFRDGTSVPQAVVEYWIALAIRLKDPGAHGQFGIYLDQLEPDDARALSGRVLESWIAYDTASATLEEAAAYAQANYQRHWSWYASNNTPEKRDRLIAQITREKMGEMVNSGSDTKGLLALACRADPVWAAARVRWFLKKHGRRSHQAMALLEALAGTGAPAALQVVIAASARLKQKTTQARATEIAQRYAEDRGWSVDELADRTVPSAGFDDEGELELPCGEDAKPYAARLDAALAIHLFNPDGKVVKALPGGDDENTKDSKKAFAAAKKELGQIVALQGERLFEAMCVERQWPVADWRIAFHQHPVMRRLIERLVWQGLDGEGQPLGLFRPTQEGDFTDVGDSDVAINSFAAVRLAHGALVDADTCTAWTRHLKDYEITPFIAQFDTLRSPLTAEQAEADAITDRQGWAAESRRLRGEAEKRGYQRVMRDSGGCHEYVKEFRSHAITATIWHTGSYAVDENNRVALKELKFTKAGHRGVYRLKDVPPVMLAECWADYHAVAARGAFDPDWENICPW